MGSLFFVMVDELADLTWAIVWDQIMAAFQVALRDTLDLTPDQAEASTKHSSANFPPPSGNGSSGGGRQALTKNPGMWHRYWENRAS